MTQFYEKQGLDPFEFLPLTFHIETGLEDHEYKKFEQLFLETERQKVKAQKILDEKKQAMGVDGYYSEDDEGEEEEWVDEQAVYGIHVPKNVWIMKPGENSNRGNGICVVSTLKEVQKEILSSAKRDHTHIIQKYIERPLLMHKRKFDIRVFGLLTSINGVMKGYYFDEGYLRTSSQVFSLDDLKNPIVHLTNDAIQKHDEDYCKFENANKISYQNFQKYLDS